VRALLVPLAALALLLPAARAGAPMGTAAELARAFEPVAHGLRDDRGAPMDGLDLAEAERGHVGVYHARAGGRFETYVARSDDLTTWRRDATLAVDASQPAIRRLGAGWVVAWEASERSPHVAVRRYPSTAALLAGRPDRTFDAPRTVSRTAEGTPSIAVAQEDGLVLGLHRQLASGIDRQAFATLRGWRDWRARPVDLGIEAGGNVGDRDHLLEPRLDVLEVQAREGDPASWRSFFRDPATGELTPLDARALANPSIERTRAGVVLTAFVPAEGAADRPAGTLLAIARE
jgi:hypothetical protein